MANDKTLLRRLKNLFAKVPVAGATEVSFRYDSQIPLLDDIVMQQHGSSPVSVSPAAAVPATQQAGAVDASTRLLH